MYKHKNGRAGGKQTAESGSVPRISCKVTARIWHAITDPAVLQQTSPEIGVELNRAEIGVELNRAEIGVESNSVLAAGGKVAGESLTCDCVQAVHFTMGAFRQDCLVVQNRSGVQDDKRSSTFDIDWELKPIDIKQTYFNQWGIEHPTGMITALGRHWGTKEVEQQIKTMFCVTAYHIAGPSSVNEDLTPFEEKTPISIACATYKFSDLSDGGIITCGHAAGRFSMELHVSDVKMQGFDWSLAKPSALEHLESMAVFSALQQKSTFDCLTAAVIQEQIKFGNYMGPQLCSTSTMYPPPNFLTSFTEVPVINQILAHEPPAEITVRCLDAAMTLDAVQLSSLATTRDAKILSRVHRTMIEALSGDVKQTKYVSDVQVTAVTNNKIKIGASDNKANPYEIPRLFPRVTENDCEDQQFNHVVHKIGDIQTMAVCKSRVLASRAHHKKISSLTENAKKTNETCPGVHQVCPSALESNSTASPTLDVVESSERSWSDMRGNRFLDMSCVDVQETHKYFWSHSAHHTDFLGKLLGDYRPWGEIQNIEYTQLVCALSNLDNVNTYLVDGVGTAHAASVGSNPTAGLQGHCFGVSLQDIDGYHLGVPPGEICIVESTAPVTHEYTSTHHPLGIDNTNKVALYTNVLTSPDIMHSDGTIFAELNQQDDGFIDRLYMVGNHLCVDEEEKVFGCNRCQTVCN